MIWESPSVDSVDLSESFKSFRSRRTSLTLSSQAYLRATSSATLLGGFGRRLRSSSGGIGMSKEAGEDDYQRSFAVDQVDFFLSHSWRANWRLKYLTLVFYFNLVPAVVCSTCLGIIVCSLRVVLLLREQDLGIPVWVREHFSCTLFCLPTFWFVLLSWHHILSTLPRAWRGDNIFLDKVCIHQTNMSMKEKGIKSIGGVLANSRKLLVTWDRTYFARLWCCYEISAYMATKGTSQSVIVAPIALGDLSGCVVLSQVVMEVVWSVVMQNTEFDIFLARITYCLCWFAMYMHVERRFRNYLKAIADLDAQLTAFSIQRTECFCCKSNHIHPESGERLPCDREVVYNSIRYFQKAGSVDQGLRDFDDMIRGSFKQFVGKVLRTAAPIPYRVALAAGTISTIFYADFHFSHPQLSGSFLTGKGTSLTYIGLVAGLSMNQFLQIPLQYGILMLLVKRSYYPDTGIGKCYVHLLLASICMVSMFLGYEVSNMVFTGFSFNWTLIVVVAIHILGVWWLFFAVCAKDHPWHVVNDVKPAIEMTSRSL